MSLEIVGLTFDGVDLHDFAGGIWLDVAVGILETPVVRGADTTIPAAAGSLEGNRINDYLPIELRGYVRAAAAATDLASQRASYYANLRTVRALFASNRPRAALVATLPGGTTLTIQAHPKNIVSTEVIAGEYLEASIALEGNDDWTTT